MQSQLPHAIIRAFPNRLPQTGGPHENSGEDSGHLLSLGLDIVWRRKACSRLNLREGAVVLDLCTGTGDLALECTRRYRGIRVVACDFAMPMLRLLRSKMKGMPERVQVVPVCGDALRLPFRDDTFDAAMAAFGVRNFEDIGAGLGEMHRVLQPGGQLVVLEFFHPSGRPLRAVLDLYIRHVLPLLGRRISRDRSAYHYLPQSMTEFVDCRQFMELLGTVGFKDAEFTDLTFGVATVFAARKGEP